MKIINWDLQWQALEFSPETHRTYWWPFRRRPSVIGGFGHRVGLAWVVVRKRGTTVVLSYRRHTWDLGDPRTRVSISTRGKRRVFRLVSDGVTEIDLSYRDPSQSFLARVDPSRDALDEVLDDFFLWVEDITKDAQMRSNLAKVWSED